MQTQNNSDWTKDLSKDIIEGHKEIFRKKVGKQIMSGVIYVPKKHIGKVAVVIIFNEKDEELEE